MGVTERERLNQDVIFLIERLQKEEEEKRKKERQRIYMAGQLEMLRKIQRNRELLKQKAKEFTR